MLRYAETARRCKSLKNLEISSKTSKIKEFRIDDKNLIYLPWEHLPLPHGRIRHEGLNQVTKLQS